MKKVALFACIYLSACAHTNMREITCPGYEETVWVEKSDSENEYFARASERARALAKCAKRAVHEATEE